MQSQEKIIKCYNEVADDYIVEFGAELSKKPFDRMLLKEFASANKHNGPFADFGCGPGHITKFLYDNGLKDIVGVDIASGMIDKARKIFPKIKYETGDLLNLSYDANHFGGAVSFYAIVHFTHEQVKRALCEVNRVLKPGGQLLFSFHAGDETIHYDKFLDKGGDVDFYLFQSDYIIPLLPHTGFQVIDVLERYPYKDEYPSKRAYIWAEKKMKQSG